MNDPCYFCGEPRKHHIPVGVGTRDYRLVCPCNADRDTKIKHLETELVRREVQLNAARDELRKAQDLVNQAQADLDDVGKRLAAERAAPAAHQAQG